MRAAGARHTRDFEDVVAWLGQQMAKSPITRLLRVGWRTVADIITRVVADQLDECHLEGLICIGVDEISWLALAQESRRWSCLGEGLQLAPT